MSTCSSPLGHVHKDAGTIVIGTRGKWFITDPGYQQYLPTRERNFTLDATASMQRDIEEARPSELDDQNGAAVRLGRELGVQTPAHAFVYGSMLGQERAARDCL